MDKYLEYNSLAQDLLSLVDGYADDVYERRVSPYRKNHFYHIVQTVNKMIHMQNELGERFFVAPENSN